MVLDTNVLISGAFYSGTPFRILEAFIEGELQLVLSPEIILEYKRVGEEFTRKHSNPDFESLLGLLVAQALIVEAPGLDQAVCRDPHDENFISCALAAGADVIVSGDKDLLSISGKFLIPVMKPKEFVEKYIGRGS